MQCYSDVGSTLRPTTIELAPRATALLQACELTPAVLPGEADNAKPSPSWKSSPIGIALTSDGAPGSFHAFGITAHQDAAHLNFTSITFASPAALKSAETIFPGVPIGDTTVLGDRSYQPQLSLANFSAVPLRVSVQYALSSPERVSPDEVASVIVPAQRAVRVALKGLEGDQQLRDSLIVNAAGAPGDVAVKLLVHTNTSPADAEILTKDAFVDEDAGIHPWSLEDGNRSTLLLFNQSQEPHIFHVLLSGGGTSWSNDFVLSPLETKSLSITDVIKEQVSDSSGRKFPPTTTLGVGRWFVSGAGIGKGRMLVSNTTNGMARSFSCGNYVTVDGAIWNGSISKVAKNVPLDIGSVEGMLFLVTGGSGCVGTSEGYGDDPSWAYSYSSNNTGIAKVALDGNGIDADVTGVSGGTATISGSVTDFTHGCGGFASQSVFVQVPTSLSIVAGTGSTTTEGACSPPTGACGVVRTFTYQIKDQSGNPIQVANMALGDVICTSGTNGLGLTAYTTTCSGTTGGCSGTPGPCGIFAFASGQFTEILKACSTACKVSGMCVTAGQTLSSQTWTVAGETLSSDVKTLSYQCNKILVNGS